MTVDISCVVTFHAEGLLAHKTLASIARAIRFASDASIKVELLVVADRANQETVSYLERCKWLPAGTRILHTQHGDPGLARNEGIQAACGEYVAILDGDDLYSQDWLLEALRLNRSNPSFVVHPEYNIYFGAKRWISRHPDQRDAGFRSWQLLTENAWTALSFARREIFLTQPYAPTPASAGFGYEDWHWNCDAIAAGLVHVVAPGTAHFIRLKSYGSRNAEALEQGKVLRHSSLFDSEQLMALNRPLNLPVASQASGAADKDWDEDAYLTVHADVRAAVRSRAFRSGKLHWERFGRAEGRLLPTSEQRPVVHAWNEEAYLACNEDVRDSVSRGLFESGLQHWLRYGQAEGRELRERPLPSEIVSEMLALAGYELQLFPSSQFFKGASRHTYRPSSSLGEAYGSMLHAIGEGEVTHVFLLPWLKRGGADLVALQHITYLVREFGAKVLLISTENSDSPWLSRLPEQVRVIDFGRFAPLLNAEALRLLLMRLLLRLAPQVIHNINSPIGWDIYARYGRALSQGSGLYASLFGFDYTDEQEPYGYGGALELSYRYLAKVMTDTDTFVERLIDMYGFERELFQRLRYPQVPNRRFLFDSARPARILWAGRFDREKRPDLLLAIAKRLPECHFDVYGEPTLSTPPEILAIRDELAAMRNVSVLGAYGGFENLPAANYALLLYTTQWDGLPNVILEAQASGLPVLAPDVGGISEVIPAESGFLLERFDDIEGYVRRIKGLLRLPEQLLSERKRALAMIEDMHCPEQFRNALSQTEQYVQASAPQGL
ncbi:glycosyltransferase [Cupriavidus necator]|uniref:glycosyltransferase n=1 Tax=Cupriavidus necator TaxID=106590 RepID=UPI00068E0E09|nr:glycosyltransferase [Cupriavidus necator]